MRLDKYIALTTNFSRSDAKQLAKAGEIKVNGELAYNPAQHINCNTDHISLQNQPLCPPHYRYFMLHKPAGYICSNQDGNNPIVLDLVNEHNKDKLQIAGRLDRDTTGLVLISDHGQWNHTVTSPSKDCFKRYHVTLAEPLEQEWITMFQEGILLKNEKQVTLPANLRIIDNLHAELSIQEGKYHQVKRMFAALGNKVTALHRSHIGNIELDHTLEPGQYRPLEAQEVNDFA